MRIDPSLGTTGTPEPRNEPTARSRSGNSGAVPSVAVSLGAARELVATEYDAARVAEIRAALAQGTLRVNPAAIADRLLEAAWELMRPTAS